MREQKGVPATFSVPTRRAHADTTGAARHSVGTSSGLHPEDRPYLTDERRPINRQPVYADEEDDDRLYDVRLPTSARRYAAPTTSVPRTMVRVTRHQGPPPMQRASRASCPASEGPQPAPTPHRRRFHFTVYLGTLMLIMLAGWVLVSILLQWCQVQQDTWHYGYPRTFQIDADVRHGGISHFIVVNLHGHILITELQENALQKTKVYVGPVFSGPGTDLKPATVHFQDVNGDGYPDMIIAVGSARYLLINDHSGFRPPAPADRLTTGGMN